MRRPISSSLGWSFLALLAGTTGSVAWADSPSAPGEGSPSATSRVEACPTIPMA